LAIELLRQSLNGAKLGLGERNEAEKRLNKLGTKL
jgi:hypothetical protein